LLRVENLKVAYGDVEVLHGVSLHVEEGEVVAIVGANGAGKTTLLSAISGIVPKRAGEIFVEGAPTGNLPPYAIVERGIVHIPEGRRLFPMMTVWENLELGAYTKLARQRKDQTLKQVFELFPVLGERRSQLACSLSGGEAQMCAIARGLMALPKLLMLDEPSFGLAPLLVQTCFRIIAELNQNHGTTILLVEQNVRHSLRMASRAYVLENGNVVLEGGGKELLNDDRVRRAYLGL